MTYLESRGITEEEINEWKLIESEDAVQFPLLDFRGKYVFTIKRFIDGEKKYDFPKNAPTWLFVYGLYQALPHILTEGYVVVVEGVFDCIAMHRIGFKNTVAVLSNNLTKWQALKLRRWTDRVVLLFDSDAGGKTGVKHTTALLNSRVRMENISISLPSGDPDKYIMGGKGSNIVKAINKAKKTL